MSVHVIGAGLAGLAASVRLAARQEKVILYEASPQAGGRCRSFYDKTLDCVVDNGNHLLLSGNRSALDYLRLIGADGRLIGPPEAQYPFFDLRSGKRWQICINRGPLPFWILNKQNRVPDSSLIDYLSIRQLALAGDSRTVGQCLQARGVLWDRFWDPMATSVLNTPPSIASAKLFWNTMRESFARGGDSCLPMIAKDSLADTFVDPALTFLTNHRCDLYFGQRLRLIDTDRHVKNLYFNNMTVGLEPGDKAILALPPSQIAELVPSIKVPHEHHAIVNVHFRLDKPRSLPDRSRILAIVGGVAQWIFVRDNIVSLTVSAADRLVEETNEMLAAVLWEETVQAFDIEDEAIPMPAYRVIKEKRATFSQTPEQLKLRPGPTTRWSNLFLAGDWTDTGLPATIEGAIRSGDRAADAALGEAAVHGDGAGRRR